MFVLSDSKQFDILDSIIHDNDVYDTVYGMYEKIFLSINEDIPYIYNIHVTLPHIHKNYEAFNMARKDAFEKYAYDLSLAPVSVCVGNNDSDNLTIYYQIGAKRPIIVDNPSQVLPQHYPDKYGHPIFSRAAIIENKLQISGTSSIVGSDTMYPNNFYNQFGQTLINIYDIIEHANKKYNKKVECRDLIFVVYVTDKRHIEYVDDLFKSVDNHSYTIMVADICRPDLTVEIEAWEK